MPNYRLYVDGDYIGTYPGASAQDLIEEFQQDHNTPEGAIVEAYPVRRKHTLQVWEPKDEDDL